MMHADAGLLIAPEPAPLPSLTDSVRASVAYTSARTALMTIENRRPDGTGYILRGDYSGPFISLKPGTSLSGAIVPSSETPIHIYEMGNGIRIESNGSKWFEREKPFSATRTFSEYESYTPQPMEVPCEALALHPHAETDVPQSKLALIEGSLAIRSTADGGITAWYRPDRDSLSGISYERPAQEKPHLSRPDKEERNGNAARLLWNRSAHRQ